MAEPTESESFDELKRFVDAYETNCQEIDTNPDLLKNAPHTPKCVSSEEWDRSYTRQEAAYPMEQEEKFWPAVARIDNVYGDRNLVCSCQVEMNDYVSETSYKIIIHIIHDTCLKFLSQPIEWV